MPPSRPPFRALLSVLALLLTLLPGDARSQEIALSEIFYAATNNSPLATWFELHNPSSNLVALAGWRVTRGVEFLFPNDARIEPGGYLVVAADPPTFRSLHPSVSAVVGGWTGFLSPGGEEIRIEDANFRVVDEVTYAAEGDWAVRRLGPPDGFRRQGWEWHAEHRGLGASLERIHAGLPNEYGQNWGSSSVPGGTPGRPNSIARTATAPLVVDVRHLPTLPRSTDTVLVTARLIDDDATAPGATLFWRVDGETEFRTAALRDDGTGGDPMAGDGRYTARLPAHPDGTLVEYRLVANDAAGASRAYPDVDTSGAGDRSANLLYRVEDTAVAAEQPVFRLWMPRAEYAYLADAIWSGSPNSDAAVHGAFVASDAGLDGETTPQIRQLCGFRNRGHGTRTVVPHNFRVDFPADRPWKGRDALNLNTHYTHSQQVGSTLFRRLGIPVPESRPVQVRVNGAQLAKAGQEQFGSYAANEPTDDRFVERQFPNDDQGNLYRGVRDRIPGIRADANLVWLGDDFAAYTNAYAAENHAYRVDGSDLLHLIDVLNHTPDSAYVREVRGVADVEQWMRYFAVNTLLGNQENCLANGAGDDFVLYRGARDGRFVLLPYDLDSVLGRGTRAETYADGIWRMTNIVVLDRLVKHPEFAPLYFRHLEQLAHGAFAPAELDPLLDRLLGPYVSPLAIANMKQFATSHVAHVLSRFPRELAVVHDLPLTNGSVLASSPVLSLRGTSHPGWTRAVEIDGRPAVWSAWEGTWSLADIPLRPGSNRVVVRALGFDGEIVARATLDVLFDDGTAQNAPAVLTADTVWTAANGPYRIEKGLTVPDGITLALEAGTTIYLGANANLVVEKAGRLLANGTHAAPIRFASPPGSGTSWGGVVVRGGTGSPENRLSHVLFEGNGTTCIESSGGTLVLEELDFGTTSHPYVSLDDSSFVVARCRFPATSASFEPFHGSGGIKAGGRGIIHRCFFGASRGYNDIIDFTGGNRPDRPILQVYDNVFAGSTDDILDLDGTDAWIEGNIFLHVHRNGAPDSSAAVSGGSSGTATSEITILENLFFDCDNAVTAKQGNFYALLHNTIVHTTKTGGVDFDSGVVNLRDTTPDITRFGRGAYLEGNVVVDAENLLRNYDPAESVVTLRHNILPSPWSGAGTNNIVADPLLRKYPTLAETEFGDWESAQILRTWFSLREGSPASGAGPGGRDLGASGSRGAFLSGGPPSITASASARFEVGIHRTDLGAALPGFPAGAGFDRFRWRLDGGAWSADLPIDSPILVDGLAQGRHVLEVSARNDAGTYQDDPDFGTDARVTRSREWVVDRDHVPPEPTFPAILHEVLAHAQDTPGATDLIELRNDGETPIDLSGMGLTDDPTLPYRFAFPPGTRIAPGAYLVLAAGPAAGGHAFATGFALDADGDRLFLVRTPESGAAVVDSVRFGPQVPGISVGRRRDGSWGPCVPTFGGPNVALLTGDPRRVRINEWLADARFAGTGDFVELYNPETLVVDLSGCRLSDAAGSLDRFVVPPLTFVGPRSHIVFRASGDGTPDGDRLPFRLSSDSGILALSSPEGERIDVVDYASARTDVSQGRSPDGSSTFSAFPMPTPGSNNPGNAVGECTESTLIVPLVPMGSRWRYQQSANLDGTGWQLPDYDDSSWPEGPALLAVETSALPSPGKNTELSIGRTTYYFRTRFLVSTNLEGFRLHGSMVVDDGARVFLNGRAIWTNGLPSGVIAYATPANRNVGNADIESIPLPSDALLPGTNVLAAEVHQVNASSTDIVWGLAVEARRTVVECTPGTLPTIALDEVLVLSRPDPAAEPRTEGFVEVVNFGSAPVSLEGMSLSDDPGRPAAWLFPAATSVAPGQRIVVDFGASPRATTAPPGFSLRPRGGALYLYDARDRGGSLLDAVRYGIQIPDHSIARVPSGIGPWALARPTPGSTNTPAVLADPSHLKVNEWLADPIEGGDWFELHNTSDLPVGLAGTFLTDDFADPTRAPVAPLSFIGSGRDAFVRFFADGDTAAGPDHVGFSLRRAGESLAVYAPEGWLVDGIVFGPQTTGVSQGRLPDGGAEIAAFRVPSPASSNRLPSNDSDSDGLDDAWERSYFGGLDRDGTGDADADGARDADEFSAGTNPVDADDVLRFAEISVARPTSLRFRAKAGRSYAVQVRDTLSSDTAWALLQSVPARDAAEWVTVIDAGFAPSARFYRLVTPAP